MHQLSLCAVCARKPTPCSSLLPLSASCRSPSHIHSSAPPPLRRVSPAHAASTPRPPTSPHPRRLSSQALRTGALLLTLLRPAGCRPGRGGLALFAPPAGLPPAALAAAAGDLAAATMGLLSGPAGMAGLDAEVRVGSGDVKGGAGMGAREARGRRGRRGSAAER